MFTYRQAIPASDDIPFEEDNLSKRIHAYCSRIEVHQRCEKDTHYVTLNSIKEYKARQRQQGKRIEMKYTKGCHKI